jgi:hypothetical protein
MPAVWIPRASQDRRASFRGVSAGDTELPAPAPCSGSWPFSGRSIDVASTLLLCPYRARGYTIGPKFQRDCAYFVTVPPGGG